MISTRDFIIFNQSVMKSVKSTGELLILDESTSGLDGQNYAPDRGKAEKRGAERQNHSRDHPRQGADRELLR